MELWETVLRENKQDTAKAMVLVIENKELTWVDVCIKIDYGERSPFDDDGYMTSHFRRVLTEIKLLSVFGGHTFTQYQGEKNGNCRY